MWQFVSWASNLPSQSVSNVDISVPWSSCSVLSLVISTGRMVSLLIPLICTSWFKLATMAKVLMSSHSNRQMAVLVFVFSKDLGGWRFYCFGIFWTVSDVFKADILPTSERQVSLARQTFCNTGDSISDCRYEYWKRLMVWKRKGLACEIKPQRFVGIIKSRCSQLQAIMNWWYKGHYLAIPLLP